MQSLSKYNKGIKNLLCVINLFSEYEWVIPLKYKKGVGIVNVFQSILDSPNRNPNKIWVDQGSEFCNNYFKDFLKITLRCIQHTMQENLLLQRDLLEL